MSAVEVPMGSPGRSHRFVIVDVFTDHAFGGNQLAVFPDARGLSAQQMQAAAREFNFAETTFVIPASDREGRNRVRIFTPRRELPFAGHPTVGTAAAMSFLRPVESPPDEGWITYEEGIGPVMVRTSPAAGRRVFAELSLQASLELPAAQPVLADIAKAISLDQEQIVAAWYAAIGIPFCYVHLADKRAVDTARLDHQCWRTKLAETPGPQIFLFAGALESGAELYARMFAPALGIEEDPATGSACLTLMATFAKRQQSHATVLGLTVRQGVAMGRPSAMTVFADMRDGEVHALRLGGNSVIVAEGAMSFAAAGV